MSDTKIEWATKTWNPTLGCSPVASGCANCYAVPMAHRVERMATARRDKSLQVELLAHAYRGLTVLQGNGKRGWSGQVRLLPDRLLEPMRWKTPQRVFVDSMSDLFWGTDADLEYARRHGVAEPWLVPFHFIDQVFAVMAICPRHTFIILTKRPGRMREYLESRTTMAGGEMGQVANAIHAIGVMAGLHPMGKLSRPQWPLPNVILGTSASTQHELDAALPDLLATPAAVRCLSLEPLLGPIDLGLTSPHYGEGGATGITAWRPNDRACALHWVIVGGESGPGARPCDVGWLWSIVEQCRAAGVPCFVKQLGAKPWDARIACLESIEEMRPEHLNSFGRKIVDRKGGDPAEWPEGLRVRQWPKMEGER